MNASTTISQVFFLATLLAILQFPQQATSFSLTMSSGSNEGVASKLDEMGIKIRQAPSPKGNYISCVRTGNLLHLCGHIPQTDDGTLITGRLGEDLSTEQGYESAKWCAINILNTLHAELDGDWDRVVRIVKVVGFVNSADSFQEQPAVINGASDLFGQVFGEKGIHARSAVGSNALPLGIATEVEAIVEIKD